MSPENILAIVISVITSCAGLCTIIVFAINRGKDKKKEGKEKGNQDSDLQYIKRRVDDILLDNKESNRQLVSHETRISVLEMSTERLKDIPSRVTKTEEEISATNNRVSNLERN